MIVRNKWQSRNSAAQGNPSAISVFKHRFCFWAFGFASALVAFPNTRMMFDLVQLDQSSNYPSQQQQQYSTGLVSFCDNATANGVGQYNSNGAIAAMDKAPAELESARRIMFPDIVSSLTTVGLNVAGVPPKIRRPTMYTSYQKSTVIQRASWFQPERLCQETCCARTIAVALDADEHHLITTVDGLDLADVVLHGHRKNDFLEWGQSDLSHEIIPCFQPGVVVYSDAGAKGVDRFFAEFRENVTVPYVFVSGDTDSNQPVSPHGERLDTDDLLVAWYGINPAYARGANHKKFRMMHLGLARLWDQQHDLLALQEARLFQNPFAGSAKERWTKSSVLRDASDTSQLLFVKFGQKKQWRIDAYQMACHGRTTNHAFDTVSCTDSKDTTRDTYSAASKYLFGLSPPGNGYDCFRTYELLYLGIIPVIQARAEADELFRGLPVIQLKGWNYTQMELVNIFRDYVSSRDFQESTFEGWERLYLAYHRERVLRDTKRAGEIIQDDDGRKYYKKWVYTRTG